VMESNVRGGLANMSDWFTTIAFRLMVQTSTILLPYFPNAALHRAPGASGMQGTMPPISGSRALGTPLYATGGSASKSGAGDAGLWLVARACLSRVCVRVHVAFLTCIVCVCSRCSC
jgi:hypothetical protein